MRNRIWEITAVVGLAVLMFWVVPVVQAPALTGSISGMKFNDTNGNGIKDPGEVGLAGWKINLTNMSSGAVITTQTDAAGNYVFSNLPDGTYEVGERIKPGYLQTAPALSFNGSATYTVPISGGSETGKDFGNLKKGLVLGGGWLNPSAEFLVSARYFDNDVIANGSVMFVDHVANRRIEGFVNTSGIDGRKGVLTGRARVNGTGPLRFYEVRMGEGRFNISVPGISYSRNLTLKNGTMTIADGGIVFTNSISQG